MRHLDCLRLMMRQRSKGSGVQRSLTYGLNHGDAESRTSLPRTAIWKTPETFWQDRPGNRILPIGMDLAREPACSQIGFVRARDRIASRRIHVLRDGPQRNRICRAIDPVNTVLHRLGARAD